MVYLPRGVKTPPGRNDVDRELLLHIKSTPPASKNYTHPHAPVYFVNGAAGNREGQSGFYTNENPWSVLRTKDRGFMTMVFVQEAEDAVRMTSKFIQSRTGAVVDTVDLLKKV